MGPPDGWGSRRVMTNGNGTNNQHQSNLGRRSSIENRSNNRVRNNWNRLSRFSLSVRDDNDSDIGNSSRDNVRQQETSNRDGNSVNENGLRNNQIESTSAASSLNFYNNSGHYNQDIDNEMSNRTPRASFRSNIISMDTSNTPLLLVNSIPLYERVDPIQTSLSSSSARA